VKVTITGKRGGTKTLDVRTVRQLEEAIRRTPHSFDRKHDQMMLLGSFIAEKLVEIEAALAGRKIRRGTQPSEWNRFFAEGMKAGKSPTQIGEEWQAQKVKKVS
jgi:hypothetical protein